MWAFVRVEKIYKAMSTCTAMCTGPDYCIVICCIKVCGIIPFLHIHTYTVAIAQEPGCSKIHYVASQSLTCVPMMPTDDAYR